MVVRNIFSVGNLGVNFGWGSVKELIDELGFRSSKSEAEVRVIIESDNVWMILLLVIVPQRDKTEIF